MALYHSQTGIEKSSNHSLQKTVSDKYSLFSLALLPDVKSRDKECKYEKNLLTN